jgi:phosphoglycerate dehydrogenase-like enzyme
MPKIGVVIHRPLRESLFTTADWARLHELGEVVATDSAEPISSAEAIALLQDCEVGIGSWGSPNVGSAALVAACPKLRLWEHVAGTVKNMFGPHLAGRELTIASCKTAIADCVAEMTLGLLICGVRGLFANALANRSGRCGKGRAGVLYGSRIGIVGVSAVGQRVARLLHQHPGQVLAYDPYCDPALAQELGLELVADLAELCRRVDALTLHTPYLDATHHLVQAEHFQALPDHALVINTARGACLDQAALQAELERGRLFACLDVTEPEPLPDDHPLRDLPNCLITSHIAGPATVNMGAQCVADVAAFLAGKQPLAVITPDMLAITA